MTSETPKSVEFNGTSLQTDNIKTITIPHEAYNNRDLQIEQLSINSGGKLVRERIGSKTIPWTGYLLYDTIAELEEGIDDLKQLLNEQEKNLDIDYGNGVRRYVATLNSLNIQRGNSDIETVPFSGTFTVPKGYGEATSSTSHTTSGETGNYTNFITVTGTKQPQPIITIDVNTETDLTSFAIQNATTNRTINIDFDYIAGDQLVVNVEQGLVTINGINRDYTGSFPQFQLAGNTYVITPTATAVNYDVDLTYTPRYL